MYILVNKLNKSKVAEFSCCTGDISYTIYKKYLIVEAPTANSARESLVMLYKIEKKHLKLIDLMSNAHIDFVPALERTKEDIAQYGASDEIIAFIGGGQKIKVADYDKDGKPEMIVIIDDENSRFKNPGIQLYVSFDDNGFKLNKNPNLYKPLFKKYANVKNKASKKYVYSVLSKQKIIGLHFKKDTKKYLNSILNLDYELHNGYFNKKTHGLIECK